MAIILWFKDRHKLVKIFEKWCKENDADANDKTNFVTWLNMKGLLNEDEVHKFLKEDKGEVKLD